ncbi:MAG: glycosyltransferase, partial [Acidobacteriota bacterium]
MRCAEDDRGLLSVLMVNFNGGDLLLRALGELERAAGGTPHEVLVADNGSTDGSAERLRRLRPEVRVLELGENHRFGAANNRAAAAARGDRFLLLNSDAWPLPG